MEKLKLKLKRSLKHYESLEHCYSYATGLSNTPKVLCHKHDWPNGDQRSSGLLTLSGCTACKGMDVRGGN